MTLTWFRSRPTTLSRRLLSVSATATRLVAARAAETSREAEVSFADGSTFLFHALWLRDACRDASCVEAQSERKLSASPLVTRLPMSVGIKQIHVDEDGQSLRVEWDCGDVERSTFEAGFLRALAPRAGKQLAGAEAPTDRCGIDSWFEFLNGKNDTACPPPSELALWTAAKPAITRVPYAELASGRLHREHLLRAIIDPGVVIVEGMPDDVRLDGTVLSEFAAEYLGGLQKHPRRDNAHWTISTEETMANSNMVGGERGATNAYDTNKQLCNHTDQSLYGLPGLLLAFHCAHGQGNNSLTDGFAVAYALRERHPEHFAMLAQYGMNAGRHLGYYTSGPLLFDTAHPVLRLDAEGNLSRVQYHESYRTPVTLPFDVFPKYMAALDAFYAMVHSPEFQTHLTLHEGELLIMNNWRTMHGRAGLAGKTRTILGGTVTREAFYSAVREEAARRAGVAPGDEVGIPTSGLKTLPGAAGAARAAAEELRARGYAHVRLGEGATLRDMERVARPLLGLALDDTANRYNGGGGVTRPTLGDSSFLDAGLGAPRELTIQFHNEMAYAERFPARVAFAMARPAESDGTTTLCDNVQLTARLSPALRARMRDGVRYTRVLHPEADRAADPLFYTSWEGAFQTDDLATAFERAAGDGGHGALELMADERRLMHTLWSPVFLTHPEHGELYFSSILNRHGSWLDGHATFGQLPLAERPYHCLWADGSELSAAELDEIRQVHAECTQHLQLVRGDVLVLDNLRVAHGRTPWAGSDRQMGLLLSDLVPREAHRTPPKAFLQWAAEAHDEHVAQEVDHARAAAAS